MGIFSCFLIIPDDFRGFSGILEGFLEIPGGFQAKLSTAIGRDSNAGDSWMLGIPGCWGFLDAGDSWMLGILGGCHGGGGRGGGSGGGHLL